VKIVPGRILMPYYDIMTVSKLIDCHYCAVLSAFNDESPFKKLLLFNNRCPNTQSLPINLGPDWPNRSFVGHYIIVVTKKEIAIGLEGIFTDFLINE